MPGSHISVLTYNRQPTLAVALEGLLRYCPDRSIAVFEDGGYFDDTRTYLAEGKTRATDTSFETVIEAEHYRGSYDAFLGTRNLGVAGNTNRAIHWFMTQTDGDHLCVCNDDILVQGDFVARYRKAHADLGVGLLCLMPFDSETYLPSIINYRGYRVKLCPRMTGIMMSFTRECLEDIGYFDLGMGVFGNEHCDANNRARFLGHVSLDNQPQVQIDIVQDCITYQDVRTSMWGPAREKADRDAEMGIRKAAMRYRIEDCWRPFATENPVAVGAHSGVGIPYEAVRGSYDLVSDRIPVQF